MRVLFLSGSLIWLNTLPYGFRNLGHEIQASGPFDEKKIHRIIEEFGPDLIFTIGWGPEQTKKNQILIRKQVQSFGVPHVYWSVEDPHYTKSFTLPLLMRTEPDFVFTISSEMVEFFQKIGIPAAHLDFGYNPSIHWRVKSREKYQSKIAMVANAYPRILAKYPKHYRNQSLKILVKPLLQKKIRLDIWGGDWRKMKPIIGRTIPHEYIHGRIPYLEAYKVYSSTDILIGLQNYTNQVTQRTFEILGSGGFLLTSDTPGVRHLFHPGSELVVSSSPDETISLVRYYLKHPDEREQIRKKGQLAVENHSYTQRVQCIINTLKRNGILPDF